MRCYFDESWQDTKNGDRIGVLFGLLIKKRLIPRLDNLLYSVRNKYYDKNHAKNRKRELKGSKLFSNRTFKIANKNPEVMPINHCIAMEIISWCREQAESNNLKVFASIVYGPDPHLKCLDPNLLELPFSDLFFKISAAAEEMNRDEEVTLIFDQRLGAQLGIAISLYNFVKGVGLSNLNPYPYFAVSNIDPGVQVADIFAFILGRRSLKDPRFFEWYNRLKKLQWNGTVKGKKRWGFQRYQSQPGASYKIRKSW